jgi:hypothetical protein
MIAVLYADPDGPYADVPNVDIWGIDRDARRYPGPHPVIAHPPCNRWCQLASVNEARWGTPIGDDDGCFQAALAAVRRWGGILEHPAYSLAWNRYHLPDPIRGGWQTALGDPGMATEVSQSAYGHPARKRTWLYYVGDNPPPLDWTDPHTDAVVGAGIHTGECIDKRRLTPDEAIHTPAAFRDLLISTVASTDSRHQQETESRSTP